MAYKRSHIPKLGPILKKVGIVARATLDDSVTQYATEQRDLFVKKIKEQRFASFHIVFYPESGTNLSPRWLARKAAKGADDRTGIATGHYVSQIKVFRTSKKDGSVSVRVGFHPSTLARDLDGDIKNITLNRVARVLEHGSEKMQIPARPHWGPHENAMIREAGKVRIRFAKKIRANLKLALPDVDVWRT